MDGDGAVVREGEWWGRAIHVRRKVQLKDFVRGARVSYKQVTREERKNKYNNNKGHLLLKGMLYRISICTYFLSIIYIYY